MGNHYHCSQHGIKFISSLSEIQFVFFEGPIISLGTVQGWEIHQLIDKMVVTLFINDITIHDIRNKL